MAKVEASKSVKKDTAAPVKKAPATTAKKAEVKKAEPAAKPAAAPKATKLTQAPKAAPAKPAKPAPKPKKPADVKAIEVKKPAVSTTIKETKSKTIYHVSKRGETKADRVWKVFIQGSDKVIKLFDTQQEALDYAKGLCDNKNDGSTVMLHGLDGKIRKY